jgi:hypothetical protein
MRIADLARWPRLARVSTVASWALKSEASEDALTLDLTHQAT